MTKEFDVHLLWPHSGKVHHQYWNTNEQLPISRFSFTTWKPFKMHLKVLQQTQLKRDVPSVRAESQLSIAACCSLRNVLWPLMKNACFRSTAGIISGFCNWLAHVLCERPLWERTVTNLWLLEDYLHLQNWHFYSLILEIAKRISKYFLTFSVLVLRIHLFTQMPKIISSLFMTLKREGFKLWLDCINLIFYVSNAWPFMVYEGVHATLISFFCVYSTLLPTYTVQPQEYLHICEYAIRYVETNSVSMMVSITSSSRTYLAVYF